MPSWRDWLYETDPVWDYPELRGELPVPGIGGVPVDMSGGRSDIPQVAGKERTGRKTKLGSALLDILPRVLQAGIAGGATPASGSGPTDFFRAAQAGAQALDRRDANRLAMEQQYQQMAAQEEQRRAQQEMYGAHADLYRAQAQKALTPEPGFLDKYNQLIAGGMDKERAAIVASGGSLQHMKADDPHKGMTRVDEGDPLARYGRPDGKGGFWVDNEIVTTALRPEPRTPSEPRTFTPFHVPGEGKAVNLVVPDPESPGGAKTIPLGDIGRAPREPAGEKPKRASPADYLRVKTTRDRAIRDAEEEFTEAQTKAMAEAEWVDDPAKDPLLRQMDNKDREAAKVKIAAATAVLERKKRRAVEEYLDGVAVLTAASEPAEAATRAGVPGARPPAAAPPKAPPSIPGTWRGEKLGRKK